VSEWHDEDRAVPMVRYECGVCAMVATCVVTPASELAWLDHMARHADPSDYRGWTWAVLELPSGRPSTAV
jgi:hypothetical protein